MNSKKKRFAAALTAFFAAVMTFGCKNKTEESSVPDEVLKQPFSLSMVDENPTEDDPTNKYGDLDVPDPTASKEDTTASDTTGNTPQDATAGNVEYVEVTDASGETVTQFVAVTDAGGAQVTEADGQVRTEAVPVTEAVTVPENVTSPKTSENPGGEQNTTVQSTGKPEDPTNAPATKPSSNRKIVHSFWFDISKKSDFVFNGDFVSVKFKVKEDAPDGIYEADMVMTDFANYAGETLYPENTVNPKICVNKSAEQSKEYSGFSVYGDNVSCKPGDEITVTFKISGNPGMCAVIFRFAYDQNIFEMLSCEPAGEYAEISRGNS